MTATVVDSGAEDFCVLRACDHLAVLRATARTTGELASAIVFQRLASAARCATHPTMEPLVEFGAEGMRFRPCPLCASKS